MFFIRKLNNNWQSMLKRGHTANDFPTYFFKTT